MTAKTRPKVPLNVMLPETQLVLRLEVAGLISQEGSRRHPVWVGFSLMTPLDQDDWQLRIVIPDYPNEVSDDPEDIEARLSQAIRTAIERLFAVRSIPDPVVLLKDADYISWDGKVGTLYATFGQFAYRAGIHSTISKLSNHQKLTLGAQPEIAYLQPA